MKSHLSDNASEQIIMPSIFEKKEINKKKHLSITQVRRSWIIFPQYYKKYCLYQNIWAKLYEHEMPLLKIYFIDKVPPKELIKTAN